MQFCDTFRLTLTPALLYDFIRAYRQNPKYQMSLYSVDYVLFFDLPVYAPSEFTPHDYAESARHPHGDQAQFFFPLPCKRNFPDSDQMIMKMYEQ